MATQILASAGTVANSADVVVAAGTPITVAMKGYSSPDARIDISLKDDGGNYVIIGSLDTGRPAVEIEAPGAYRFSRQAGAICGVFSA